MVFFFYWSVVVAAYRFSAKRWPFSIKYVIIVFPPSLFGSEKCVLVIFLVFFGIVHFNLSILCESLHLWKFSYVSIYNVFIQNPRVEIENEGNKIEEHKFDLNPDHSHFLIVKDGTINKTGINYFLLRLQHYLASVLEQPRKSASNYRKLEKVLK